MLGRARAQWSSLLAALVASCRFNTEPSPPPPPPPPAAPTLSVTPASAIMTEGSLGGTFRASVANSDAGVTWALVPTTGAGSLSGASSRGVQYTPPVSVTCQLSVSLVASLIGSGVSVTVPITVTAASGFKLTGKVLDAGLEPRDASVTVAGCPPVSTDAAGRFTVYGVTAPYNVTAQLSDNTTLVYAGLTRADPTLVHVFGGVSNPLQRAQIRGTISGGAGYPEPVAQRTLVAFLSSAVGRDTLADAARGSYLIGPIRWRGAATTLGALYALQWRRDAAGMPVEYTGLGVRPGITLGRSDSLSAQDISLQPVSQSSIAGDAVLPAGYSFNSKQLALLVDAGEGAVGRLRVVSDLSQSASFNYVVPNIPGSNLELDVTGIGPNATIVSAIRRSVMPGASGLTVPIPAAFEHRTPADGAGGVTENTEFTWAPLSNAAYAVYMYPEAGGNPAYVIMTTGSSLRFSTLGALGVTLPRGVQYHWMVFGAAPFSSLDEAAGPLGRQVTGDGVSGFTLLPRAFTTS